MLLPGLGTLDMCCPSLGLCAFNVNRTRCAALRYVGQYVQSRIVLLLGQCALDMCCPGLGLYAFDVNRTRYAALRYVGYMCSPVLCSCRDYVRSTCAGRA